MGKPLLNAYVDDNDLVLVHRDAEGNLREERKRATWDCFVRKAKVPESLRQKIESSAHVASVRTEGEFLRIGWKSWEARRRIASTKADEDGTRSPFAVAKVEVFEGDVSPVRRLLVDEDFEIQKPRTCWVDIETDSRKSFDAMRKGEARVVCWTITDENEEIVAEAMLEEDDDDAEEKLLTAFWQAIKPYDRVGAWSSRFARRMDDTFDFLILKKRSRMLRVRTGEVRHRLWFDHCKVFMKINMQVAESGDEKSSMKLDDIAEAVLKEKKRKFNPEHVWACWELGSAPRPGEHCPGCGRVHDEYGPRRCLQLYNNWDAILMPRIEKARAYIGLLDAIAQACGIFADSGGADSLCQIDTFLLRLGRRAGYRFPTVQRFEEEAEDAPKQFRGAFVLKPTARGIQRNVHVCDFSRLYPSLLISFNMSPETKVNSAPINGPIADGCCRTPTTGITFRTGVQGIIPTFLLVGIKLRKEWNEKKAKATPGTQEWRTADQMSNAYKVLVNACYGIVGSDFSRYYDVEIAEAVTQTAVWLIKRVISNITRTDAAWRAIAGDTDSSFIIGPDRVQMESFVRAQNDEIKASLPKYGCQVVDVSLAYEKEFSVIAWASKDGDPAAKKYFGRYAHYKGSLGQVWSEPEVKGLEIKRGDSIKLARRLQEKCIRMIVGDWECDSCRGKDLKACPTPELHTKPVESAEEYRAFIARARDHVLSGKLKREEIILSKGLSQSVSAYAQKVKKDGTNAAQPVHVAVAKMLKARGADVSAGSKISYVVVDASDGIKAIPAVDFTMGETDFDRFYLWEQLVWPPTQRVLEGAFPDQDWSEFDSVRPKKPRAPKKGGAAEGQGGLFDPRPPRTTDHTSADKDGPLFAAKPAPPAAPPAVPRMRRRGGPYYIEIPRTVQTRHLERLKEILTAHPGERPAIMKIGTYDDTGAKLAELELDTKISVSGTLELVAQIERLLAS